MKRALVAATLALGMVGFLPAPAQAASINVTTIADETLLDTDNGSCSLREAISAANSNARVDSCTPGQSASKDFIVLQANQTYILDEPGADDTNAGGDLDILDQDATNPMGNLDINVTQGATILQQVTSQRVIHIDPANTLPATTVALNRVQISGGNGSGVAVSGAGVFNHGSLVTLSIFLATITGNHGSDGSSGGGVLSDGDLSINGTEIFSNSAGNFGGAVFGKGDTSINKTTFTANTVGADGGAIYFSGSGKTIGLDNSTISGNFAGRHGGGVYLTAGAVEMRDVTVTNNTADTGTPNDGEGGGIHRNIGTVDLNGTILAGNHDLTGGGPDCFGMTSTGPTSSGHNLIGDDTGCFFTPGTGDIVNPTDPLLLSELQDNGPSVGHVMRTHLPLPGSPALDAAEQEDCSSNNQDERSFNRPSGSACDIGAVEAQVPEQGPVAFEPHVAFQLKKKFEVSWQESGDETGLTKQQLRPRASKHNSGSFTNQPLINGLGSATSTDFTGKPGFTYCFGARFQNGDQQFSPFGDEACTSLPVNNTSLKKGDPLQWDLKKGKGYYLRTFSQAKQKGAELSLKEAKKVRTISLVATKCPGCGKVRVSLGNDVLGAANLDAPTTKKKQLILIDEFNSPRSGKVTIEVRSDGKPVKIEGLGISKVVTTGPH